MKFAAIVVLSSMGCPIAGMGCSSVDTPASHSATGPVGSAVSGPADHHCASQEIGISDPSACTSSVGLDEGGAGNSDDSDDASGDSGGAADCNLTHDAEYGPTLYGDEGDDDDCKYHASWSSTPIRLNQDVTFTLSASSLVDNLPLEGLNAGDNALSRLEVYEPCIPTHLPPAQDFKATITELSPGVYTAGPLRFDHPGRWVVRFHFYEQCIDQEDSPHGHIAFFIDVP